MLYVMIYLCFQRFIRFTWSLLNQFIKKYIQTKNKPSPPYHYCKASYILYYCEIITCRCHYFIIKTSLSLSLSHSHLNGCSILFVHCPWYPVHLRNHFPTLIHFVLWSASKHHSSIIINCLYLQTLFRHSQLYTNICTCMACPALLSLSYHYAMLCYTCQSINLRINPSVHHHQF